LQRLQGVNQSALPLTLMRADFDWLRPDKRQEFLRVRRNTKGGLDLFPNQSSGVLSSVVWGDGLVDNPAGQSIRQGEQVGFVAFNDLLG
jgi:molybdopterin molybdotransferase